MTALKLTQIGNSVGLILPKELLAKLGVGKGDTVYAIDQPDGIRLTVADPDFEAQMAVARKLMKAVGLSGFDRFLGALLGLVKGGLVVAVVLMGMTAFTPTSKLLENSRLAPYFLVVGRAAIWVAPAALRARFYEGLDFLRRAPKEMTGAPASRSK